MFETQPDVQNFAKIYGKLRELLVDFHSLESYYLKLGLERAEEHDKYIKQLNTLADKIQLDFRELLNKRPYIVEREF